AAILARPASDLVIDLLGPDRGLKRLSVTAIDPATLEKPPMIQIDDALSEARRLFASGAERVLVMEGDERLYGELDRDAANGEGRVRDRVSPVGARIGADRTLYDAFSQMLIHRASWVAVLSGDRLVGVLTPASFLSAIRNVPAELEGAGAAS
ncbi:MAG TPA: CBS domain-containing protein, partial [Candidatus Dormibacteraeota bacterium]|nr:CBS domain-containing protein [Candidatus Dormibacteraeota bacterium]